MTKPLVLKTNTRNRDVWHYIGKIKILETSEEQAKEISEPSWRKSM